MNVAAQSRSLDDAQLSETTPEPAPITLASQPPESDQQKKLRLKREKTEFKAWQAARFKGIDRQQRRYSCGAAALANLLTYHYGMKTNEASLLASIKNSGNEHVLSMNDIVNMANSKKVSMAGYRINMQQLASMRQPVIVQLKEELYNLKKDDILAEEKAGGYGSQSQAHFVIVTSVSEELVHVKDPALGNREISIKEFSEFWLDANSSSSSSGNNSARKGVVLAIVGKTQ